jgi:hypothetical protein
MTSRVVVQAYRDRIQAPASADDCHLWTGARSRTGEGWHWIGSGRVVLAHRFGYAVEHGVEALLAAPALAHTCANPLCQNLGHLAPVTVTDERTRAALVLREAAARDGQSVAAAILAGVSALRRRPA